LALNPDKIGLLDTFDPLSDSQIFVESGNFPEILKMGQFFGIFSASNLELYFINILFCVVLIPE